MKKKLLAFFLVGATLMTSLTACGKNDTKESQATSESKTTSESTAVVESTPSEKEFDPKTITDGVTLTIAVQELAPVRDWETNDMTKTIEEKFGVNLDFITYPAADFETKLNVMAMSGEELPDIIFAKSSNNTWYAEWAAEGAVLELSEYYADPNMSPNVREVSEKIGIDLEGYLRDGDGKIWALPKYNASATSEGRYKLWVYTPWLEALGKEVPETTEEFYEVCKAVVSSDLNGNGKKDEVGIGGDSFSTKRNYDWFGSLMNAFVYAGERNYGYAMVEDGKVDFAYTTDAWREGLRYIRKFFEEGIIPEAILTYDNAQADALLYPDGDHMAFSLSYYNYGGSDPAKQLDFTYIPALKGPEGVQYATKVASLPSAGAIISTDCENPDAAFLVLDYMCSEEFSITGRYGKQGEDWDYWEDAKIENKADYTTSYGKEPTWIAYDDNAFWSNVEPQDKCWRQQGPFVRGMEFMTTMAVPKKAADEAAQMKADFTNLHAASALSVVDYWPEELLDYAPLTADETTEIADIKATLKTYVNEATSNFLAGNLSIDTDWDAFQEELKKIGIDKMRDVLQTAYDRVH